MAELFFFYFSAFGEKKLIIASVFCILILVCLMLSWAIEIKKAFSKVSCNIFVEVLRFNNGVFGVGE